MSEFFRRHSLSMTSLLLLIAAGQLMSASIANRAIPQFGGRIITTVLTPVEKVYHESFESVRQAWNRYVWLIDVASERTAMYERVKDLEKQNAAFIEIAKQNERLRDLLGFKDRSGFSGVPAEVIGRSSSNWVHTATIDVGSRHGIAAGMAVVDGHGLVGQTTAVAESSAQILFITDNTSSVDALVQRSRASGIADGIQGKSLSLRYVLREESMEVGDRVVSSGLDGVFPKGIVLGEVTSVRKSSKGMFQNAKLKPAVDFAKLETVLVLTPNQVSTISSPSVGGVDE